MHSACREGMKLQVIQVFSKKHCFRELYLDDILVFMKITSLTHREGTIVQCDLHPVQSGGDHETTF